MLDMISLPRTEQNAQESSIRLIDGVLLFGIAGMAQADELQLAADGKTSFSIVTPVKPIPEEATAAEWLAAVLNRLCIRWHSCS